MIEKQESPTIDPPPPPMENERRTTEGSILAPGEHLLRIAFAREVSRDAIASGLGRAGFTRVVVDEGARTLPPKTPLLLLTTLVRPVRLVDTDAVRWMGGRVLATDPFGELHYKLVPSPLAEGRTYEILFITRMKAHPKRERVLEILQGMRGFDVEELLVVKRDIRIPDHPDTSAALWFGIARWIGPPSYVNMDDPISFESVEEALVP